MSEAKTLVTLMLGGVFNGTSGPELGDIDYQVNFEEALALQEELVTNDDVYVDLVARSDFDSQRLRADTAEAELEVLKREVECRISNEVNAVEALAAAEQRIADTVAKLELAVDMLDDDERGNRFAQVLKLAIAALNPNPEAESHGQAGGKRAICRQARKALGS